MKFDEQYVYDFIKQGLDEKFDTAEWKKKFGGKKVKFSEDNFGQSTSFPVIYINIEDCYEDNRTHDSSQIEHYTQFFFAVECYNQAVGNVSKKRLGREINAEIVETLRELLNPHITSNSEILSPDDTIYRRRIDGYCTMNNETKIFFR